MTKTELENCILLYGKDIYSFCKNLALHTQEADDLYQDTFLKATELAGSIDYEKNPKSYLLSIALRIWKNKKRKYAWRNRIAGTLSLSEEISVPDNGSPDISLEGMALQKEEVLLVRRAVNALPDKLRIPVLLFYMEEMSAAQISKILKIPEGTVKSRLYLARKRLKKELEVVLNEND